MAERKNKKKKTLGCLFWVAVLLLVIVVFLFNKKTIEQVMKSTGFLDMFQTTVEVDGTPEVHLKPLTTTEPTDIPISIIDENRAVEKTPAPIPSETVVTIETPQPEPTESADTRSRKSRLFFITVDSKGDVSLKSILRTVKYKTSPLSRTIENLLEGPSEQDRNNNIITLIPGETRFLSASVKNSVAYLNFSEAFTFNSFGQEGYEAQLQQIVYTATEFSTVKKVQILINGKVREYLGSEGVYIGEPLTRTDFYE